jgi:hypothetical protein
MIEAICPSEILGITTQNTVFFVVKVMAISYPTKLKIMSRI